MPHTLPLLVAAAAAPLLGLAVHATTVRAAGVPSGHPAAVLPNNLCASCHGARRVATLDSGSTLGTRDLVAARTYLQRPPRG